MMQVPFSPQKHCFGPFLTDYGCYGWYMDGDVPEVKDSVIVNALPDENNMGFNSRLCAGWYVNASKPIESSPYRIWLGDIRTKLFPSMKHNWWIYDNHLMSDGMQYI